MVVDRTVLFSALVLWLAQRNDISLRVLIIVSKTLRSPCVLYTTSQSTAIGT